MYVIYVYIYIPYIYIYIHIHIHIHIYIYTTEFKLYVLPQNSTTDLILRTILPVFMLPEAIIYTPLYKHKGHLLSPYAEFSEELTFLTPLYTHLRLRIRR